MDCIKEDMEAVGASPRRYTRQEEMEEVSPHGSNPTAISGTSWKKKVLVFFEIVTGHCLSASWVDVFIHSPIELSVANITVFDAFIHLAFTHAELLQDFVINRLF